jgi:hypothetical protein
MSEVQKIPGKKTNHIFAVVLPIIVMISLVVFFINIGPDDLPGVFTTLMLIFSVWLLGFWIYSIVRYSKKQFGLIITQDLIVDMTNVWGITNIKKEAVQRIEIKRMMGAKWLCIYLDQSIPEAFTTNLINRVFLFLSNLQAGTPILVSELTVNVAIDEVQKILTPGEKPSL